MSAGSPREKQGATPRALRDAKGHAFRSVVVLLLLDMAPDATLMTPVPLTQEATVDVIECRRRFEAELQAADLDIPEGERDNLFVLWQDYLPNRDVLRSTPIMPEDEPTFVEKPTVRGGR